MENNSQEALLEEAKRRYPIGAKFKPAHTPTITDIYTVDSEPRFWTSGGDIIVGVKEKEDITPLLYDTKKWAEIVEEVCQYPKDSYIVLLAGCNGKDTWQDSIPINYCYKLSRDSYEDARGFNVHVDKSLRNNGWNGDSKYESKLKFRKASKEEIEEYERIGKPFNVKEFNKPKSLIGRWVKALPQEIPKKDINKDLQSIPTIEEHFIVPLTPKECYPTLSKNKRKKLEVFIPNNKQESKPFQTIKLKNTSK